jgi:hypothetical protein
LRRWARRRGEPASFCACVCAPLLCTQAYTTPTPPPTQHHLARHTAAAPRRCGCMARRRHAISRRRRCITAGCVSLSIALEPRRRRRLAARRDRDTHTARSRGAARRGGHLRGDGAVCARALFSLGLFCYARARERLALGGRAGRKCRRRRRAARARRARDAPTRRRTSCRECMGAPRSLVRERCGRRGHGERLAR